MKLEKQNFWRAFADVPAFEIDTAAIARSWRSAREDVERLLDAKLANPLEPIASSQEVVHAIADHNAQCDRLGAIGDQLIETNAQLDIVKEQARDANVAVLKTGLVNLKAVEARFDPPVAALCDDYLTEKAAKQRRKRAAMIGVKFTSRSALSDLSRGDRMRTAASKAGEPCSVSSSIRRIDDDRD